MPRSSSRSAPSRSGGSSGSGGMFGGGSRAMSTSSRPAAAAAPARAAPARAAAPTHAPAPVAQHQSMPPAMPQQGGGSMLGGLAGTIAQGFAFGTGSAIAHRAVGAIAGSFSGDSNEAAPAAAGAAPAAPVAAAGPAKGAHCNDFQTQFVQCLRENKSDIQICQQYMDNFNQCSADARLM